MRYCVIWIVTLIIAFGLYKIYKKFPVPSAPLKNVFQKASAVTGNTRVVEKDGIIPAPVVENKPVLSGREF